MTENHDVKKAELGGFHSLRHLENIGFSLELLSSQTLSSEPSIKKSPRKYDRVILFRTIS